MFNVEERIQILTDVTADLPNVRMTHFGLLVDYCRDNGAEAIVKGLGRSAISITSCRWPR